jgi:hypothetical protein
MSHVPYAGWARENNRAVFMSSIEITTDGHYVQWFARVPVYSSDGLGLAWCKAVAHEKIEGRDAIVYVKIGGGNLSRQQIIDIVAKQYTDYTDNKTK